EAGDRRHRAHYGTPAQALPELGIAPDDVNAIVITHGHWDHTGNVRQFPHAQLVMTEAEYAFWTSSLAARAQFAAHCEPEEIALLRRARAGGTRTLLHGHHPAGPRGGQAHALQRPAHGGSGHRADRGRRPHARPAHSLGDDQGRRHRGPRFRRTALLRGGRTGPPLLGARRPPRHVPRLRHPGPAGRPAAHAPGGRPRPAGPRPLRQLRPGPRGHPGAAPPWWPPPPRWSAPASPATPRPPRPLPPLAHRPA